MPVFFVKAASTSSTAFFSEAAANTVMDLSCADEADGAAAIRTAAAKAKRLNLIIMRRSNTAAITRDSGAVIRQQSCFQEATDPEAPFRLAGRASRRVAGRLCQPSNSVRRWQSRVTAPSA